MNRNNPIFFIIITAFIFIGLASCAKKQAADTPYTRIQGKWKKIKYANDDNNNHNIEEHEIHAVAPGMDNEILFNADGSGKETTVVNNQSLSTLNFSWRIVSGDSISVIYTAHDTVTYYLST